MLIVLLLRQMEAAHSPAGQKALCTLSTCLHIFHHALAQSKLSLALLAGAQGAGPCCSG